MKYVCIFAAVVFLSSGIGFLMSPMFRPELIGYNFLGLIGVLVGFFFTNIVFSREW